MEFSSGGKADERKSSACEWAVNELASHSMALVFFRLEEFIGLAVMLAWVVPLRFAFASECDSVPARVARVAPANGIREAIAA